MTKYTVTLTKEEREKLEALTSRGKHPAQTVVNALVLLACDEGQYPKERSSNKTIAQVLKLTTKTIDRVKKRYGEEGLAMALTRKPSTRVYSRKADEDLEARLIALSCSEVPKGHKRWTLRLLADKAVELKYVDAISYETVRRVFKKTPLNRGSRSTIGSVS